MKKINQFLYCATTHPDAIVTYQYSNMILSLHRNASHLSETNSRSRAGGYFFIYSDSPDPPNNGAILNIAQITKIVISSAAESKLFALNINFKESIPALHALKEMEHKQPPTPMQTNNTTQHTLTQSSRINIAT